MTSVVVGTEPSQFVTQQVLRYSIDKNAAAPVEVKCMTQPEGRVGGTNFGFVRFHVPRVFDYQGKAIYLDADQLVFTDVAELCDALDEERFDLALVKNAEGYFGGKVVEQCNQTSVMVLNCAALRAWDPDTMFANVVPNRADLSDGQIHYREFMKLDWWDQSRIEELDPRWNHFNIVTPDSRLTHFSHVRSQPWKNPSHDLANFWAEWLVGAMRAGYLSSQELSDEVRKGHVHEHFLSYA